jgi:hypothetical protein
MYVYNIYNIMAQPSKQPENIKKYNTNYYQANKAKILEDATKKVMCQICNKECSKSNLSKHIKSDKHMLNVQIHVLQNHNPEN